MLAFLQLPALVLHQLAHVKADIHYYAHAAMVNLAMAQEVTSGTLNSKLFDLAGQEIDVRMMVCASCLLWGSLFSVLWMMPSLVRLQSKKTVESLGIVGAQVETVDRLVAMVHAAVATVFGVLGWAYFFSSGLGGACGVTQPFPHTAMRTGTSITLGFIIYDMAVILVVDVIMGVRRVVPDMVLHHVTIITLATLALNPGAIGTDFMLWFFCANLLNEFSTIFLHLCKFAKECGYENYTIFKVLGAGLVLTFFTCRCVVISSTAVVLGLTHNCGAKPALAGPADTLLGVHLCLNFYWFFLIMKMILKAPKRESVASPSDPESSPLLADASGVSTDAAS